jgi:hypothetical protein
LIVDCRGEGNMAGDHRGAGFHERYRVCAAHEIVEYAVCRHSRCEGGFEAGRVDVSADREAGIRQHHHECDR